MHRRLRDAAGTALVMVVLFGVLMTVSPVVRQRVAIIAGADSTEISGTQHVASKVMASTGATAVRYAGNNTYMVFFLVVAGLLFVLMLRA